MNLRIVGAMFDVLIRDQIGVIAAEGQDQAAEVAACLHRQGIWMKESKLKPKSKSLNSAQLPKLSFIGVDTEKLVHVAEELEGIVLPESLRDNSHAGRKVQAKYDKSMAVWRCWEKVWRLFNDALDSNDAGARGARADEVQHAADAWLKAWVAAHRRTQGLYIHILVHHLSDMVREYGDLRGFQSQGLEHTHSQRKRIALTLTNRLPQSLTNKRGRTEQLMSHIVAADGCVKRQRHNLGQQDHARKAATKLARSKKRVEELKEKHGITKVVSW